MPRHSYAAAERFIFSREFFGMKLGLENITCFLDEIGSPQFGYATIHLAGTNGKGSTAVMLASMLQAQGYKTGLFTSPHLVNLRERIQVNGRRIPTRSVQAFVDRYRKELSRRKLSFFEVITAMGLRHFARAKVDIAVVETGLGGRLDASNVLQPALTIITDISRDHVEILGPTLRQIAREKAGIIKPQVPHLMGILPTQAVRVIERRCQKVGAPLYRLAERDFQLKPERNQFSFQWNGWSFDRLRPALYGRHQLLNAALAVKAISLLREQGWQISQKAIREGLIRTSWPGRFQVVAQSGSPTLVFDVCHNAGGMAAFVNAFKTRFPDKRAQIITGFVKRKEHQHIFDSLSDIAAIFHLVPLATHRSVDLDELCSSINWRDKPMRRYGSLRTAYRHVLKSSQSDDVIAIIGSHFLVGEFFEKFGAP